MGVFDSGISNTVAAKNKMISSLPTESYGGQCQQEFQSTYTTDHIHVNSTSKCLLGARGERIGYLKMVENVPLYKPLHIDISTGVLL